MNQVILINVSGSPPLVKFAQRAMSSTWGDRSPLWAHYGAYEEKIKKLGSLYNQKQESLLSKLGGSDLFKMKGMSLSLSREFRFFKGKVIGVQWAPKGGNDDLGNRIVASDQSGQVLIINAKKGSRKLGYNLTGPSRFVQAVALHPTKDIVVSGGMDNTISLAVPEAPDDPINPFMTLTKQWAGEGPYGHDGMISSLRFVSETRFLSTGGDGEVKLWDVERGDNECVATLYGHTAEAASITFPSDNPELMIFGTCSNDTTCKLWDLRTNKCTHTFHSADKLTACDFFPNGNAIAAGGQGQTTFFWDVRSIKCVGTFVRNHMKVTGVAFSKSGRALFVSHEDGRIIAWDTLGEQGNQRYAIKCNAHFHPRDPKDEKKGADVSSQIAYLGMKPDGEFLASAAFDGTVKIHGGLKAAGPQ
jgi:WD40 repeat protein